MDDFELEDLYFSIILSLQHNTSNRTGVVYIDLMCPWVKNALMIVDLPGKYIIVTFCRVSLI